ncbi:hypothetical protein MCUN1_003419 [Malassezia cuniculi]|uniref:Deacetylase sirtuin-type domain-containing protein n=1 Tax=Malassezia cuniculi TaxID=948313 RepID=A0AAF0EYE9_9BASI|nr:hypothetical protein MCUN1_003419 [Malassezia cuniculi]
MKFSIASLPTGAILAPSTTDVARSAAIVAEILRSKRTTMLTGAGVSVASGLASYRGKDGLYTNPAYSPIFFHEFVRGGEQGVLARKRYWARSFKGYPALQHAKPNLAHEASATLLAKGNVLHIITQNVDRLHHLATGRSSDHPHITEIHGALAKVMCVTRGDGVKDKWTADYIYDDTAVHAPHGCGAVLHRDVLQARFEQLNPHFLGDIDTRANPDGDAELHNVDYSTFGVPECPSCGGILKPAVVFFGENVAKPVRDQAEKAIDDAEALLVVGTSLATQSAMRLVRRALGASKPVVLLNQA